MDDRTVGLPFAYFAIIFCLVFTVPLPTLPAPRPTRDHESIYSQVRMDGIFMIKADDINLEETLGSGNFGSVRKGTYTHRRTITPVAVKVLKTSDQSAEVSATLSCLFGLEIHVKLFMKCFYCNLVRHSDSNLLSGMVLDHHIFDFHYLI